ncbi:MAG: hypothetical protein MUE68_04015 [Bacteroidetes bacterium]|jgi:hypothetical protein|nr:hypothetical protein [Bacteroidota bacterium]
MDAAQQEIAALERLVGPQGNSPLFARLADLYLLAGRPEDALRVCDSGLANFPFYTTGHFVKGRTLLALEMTNEARRELEFVRDWLPTNHTVWHYLDSLPVDDGQSLTLAPEDPVESEPSYVAPEPSAPESNAPVAPQDFFSAMTDGTPPSEAIDTAAPVAPAVEANVFGLPSEVPSGFGEFGADATETPAVEAEPSMQTFGGFSGFGGANETSTEESVSFVPEEPAASYEDTVTSAMGEGAPGFVPTETQESFETYAERLRLELGPTGIITLDQFLDGEGIVPTDSFDAAPAVEPLVEVPEFSPSDETAAVAPVFELPTPTTAEEPSLETSTAVDGFSFGGFPSFPGASEPTASETEEPGSRAFDLSGFPSADEPAPAAPTGESAPTADDGGFSGPSFEGPPPASPDTSIEGLTTKLQAAKKITPVIDFSSKSSSDESSTMASSSFVTPTLAEIYAKQGWFDDAIKAYRTLAKSKPTEREKFEARIAELEEEKKKQGG